MSASEEQANASSLLITGHTDVLSMKYQGQRKYIYLGC